MHGCEQSCQREDGVDVVAVVEEAAQVEAYLQVGLELQLEQKTARLGGGLITINP